MATTQARLTTEQQDLIGRATQDLSALMGNLAPGGQITPEIKLPIRKGQLAGFILRCEFPIPDDSLPDDWLDRLILAVAKLTGYGEVKAILDEDGTIASARMEVSYTFH